MLDNPSSSSLSTTDDGGQSGSGGIEQSSKQWSDRLFGMQEKSEQMMVVPPYSMPRYPYSHGFDGQAATLDGIFDLDVIHDGL